MRYAGMPGDIITLCVNLFDTKIFYKKRKERYDTRYHMITTQESMAIAILRKMTYGAPYLSNSGFARKMKSQQP